MISKIEYLLQELAENTRTLFSRLANFLAYFWIFKPYNFIQYLSLQKSDLFKNKQEFLDNLSTNKKVVFYVFRDLHLLDWFTPICLQLKKHYNNEFGVLFIDFGSTLKKVGKGLEYLNYYNGIEQRLNQCDISMVSHFSDQETSLFSNFPNPDLIVTSETIRQEAYNCVERIYLPHYSVPKADDTLPRKIKYNHVFLPSTKRYSYQSLNQKENVSLHEVGYPKMFAFFCSKSTKNKVSKPLVIFAPSLEVDVIQNSIKQGLLEVFKKMEHIDLLIKLHPTLAGKMVYLRSYLKKKLSAYSHISIDHQTNIQDIGFKSALMITDFGSIGAEYRLSFGKRVVYLSVPKRLEGGGDLTFRDDFGDAVVDVKDLEYAISQNLNKGDLNSDELLQMREKVLFNHQNADSIAASTIYRIASN